MKDKKRNSLHYHLRFQIILGKNTERDAYILVDFCKAHGVEEVVLFFAAEEWNNGLLSAKEEDIWFNTVKKVKSIMDKTCIITSLNPWMTVLHCSRGRSFPEGSEFKPAVSPAGEVSKACASFADSKWREYIYKLYGRFATLGFRVIWVEDDFRYHNCNPLTWGMGFEPEVISRFVQKTGNNTSMEEVVKNILKPGKPHPWRKKWLETWQEIQLEVAKGIAEAVAVNTPVKTRIGLMSSDPSAHSIEGRDWQKLFKAFNINGQVTHRPHYAGYSETLGKNKAYSIMMLDVQKNFRPVFCEVAPEVENFPFTKWTKSDSLTWTEMALCMFYGSDALLLDLFPFSGNPADKEPQIGELLDKSRPGLEWICGKFSKDLQTCGVGIPWQEDAQVHVHTIKGKSLNELNATSFTPGNLLLSYGVPVSANPQQVNAVFGTLAWAFNEKEILEMLSRGLLLDGISADILCQRGFGQYVGVDFKGWVNRENSKYALERINSGETGIHEGLYFNVNIINCISVLEPCDNAQEWTTIITPEKERIGAGIIAYKNRLNGHVITYAVPNPANIPGSYQRQIITQKIVDFLSGSRFMSPLITGGPYLLPIHFTGKNKNFAVILNGSPDAVKPIIRINSVSKKSMQAFLLAPLARPVSIKINVTSQRGITIIAPYTEIPYLGFMVLECQ